MRGPQPPSTTPSVESKPTVKRCIEQIMHKSGLGRADAQLVLRHMLQRKLIVTKDGDRITFEQMVRSQAWRPQAPLEQRPNFSVNNNAPVGEQPFGEQPSAPWPTFGSCDPTLVRRDESLDLHVAPKLSSESVGSSASSDGLELLSSLAGDHHWCSNRRLLVKMPPR